MKAASLVTTTIRPLPCPLKVDARVSARTPKKFVSITRRSSASGTSSKAPAVATPALCTTASSLLPVRESIVSVAARIDVPLVTSGCAISTPFCTSASFSVWSSRSRLLGSRIVANTRQTRLYSTDRIVSQGSPVKCFLVLPASLEGILRPFVACHCANGGHQSKARQDDVPTLV